MPWPGDPARGGGASCVSETTAASWRGLALSLLSVAPTVIAFLAVAGETTVREACVSPEFPEGNTGKKSGRVQV
eukprot:1377954-Pyramimonas_sp.AAC.1